MPTNIQVILQEDVEKLGKSGDLVRVRPGFARNFLLPRELAVPATAAALRRIEHDKAVAVARAEKAKKESGELAVRLGAIVLKVAQKAGEDGRLFGSVTAKDIEAAMRAQEGLVVDRKKIALKDPIKATGTHDVAIKLDGGVVASVRVEVVAK